MKHETKTLRAQFKAVDGIDGTFEAIVSAFGNIDLGGDRTMPGAFAKSLADWKTSGNPIPVIWSHEWDDPKSHIGIVLEAEETTEGLYVKAQLDVDNNDRAAYVARLLKERRVVEFSFGYYATKFSYVTDPDGQTVRELYEVDLFEVGPTLIGMNPQTRLIQAASALTGRKSDDLITAVRDAQTALAGVLAVVDGKAEDADPAPTGDQELPTSTEDDTLADDAGTEASEEKTSAGDTDSTINTERLAELLISIR
jgi:HK97 family phage prohead protease